MSAEPGVAERVNLTQAVITSERGDVLLVDDGGWTLPAVETRGHWHAELPPVIEALRRTHGLHAVALRVIDHEYDATARRGRFVWDMTLRHGQAVPPTARWLDPAEALRLLGGRASPAVVSWIEGRTGGGDGTLPGWTRAGWFDEALAWCGEHLGGRAVALDEAEQVKQWSIASIMRVPTRQGDAWFKAVPPIFAHEGAVLSLIAPSLAEHLPAVIATDGDRGWTLMEAIPQTTLRDHPKRSAEAMKMLAALHRHWAGRDAALLAAGCLDRRLDTLQPGLTAILSRGDAMARFDAESRSRIEAYCAQIPQLIAALRECGLPETLVHGDFHAGNVAVDGDRTIIFDWTDACLSHPLFDLATFLPDDPVERAELLHAYFSAWAPELSEEQMDRAWEIAEPLAGVHHAVSYTRILEAVDSRDHWEFDSDVLFWLRWLQAIAG